MRGKLREKHVFFKSAEFFGLHKVRFWGKFGVFEESCNFFQKKCNILTGLYTYKVAVHSE